MWTEKRGQIYFLFQIRPVRARPKRGQIYFLFQIINPSPFLLVDALKYWRADVYLPEGGQDYDVMGWSKESVINDVLDHYHRHLNFLEAVR